GFARIEIAQRAAQKQQQQRPPAQPRVRPLAFERLQTVQILVRQRRDLQPRRRYLNRKIRRRGPPALRLQNPPRLARRAAAQLGDQQLLAKCADNLLRVPPDEPLPRRRQPVLRQSADGFKQQAPHLIVEVLAGQGLLPRAQQSCSHVLGQQPGIR